MTHTTAPDYVILAGLVSGDYLGEGRRRVHHVHLATWLDADPDYVRRRIAGWLRKGDALDVVRRGGAYYLSEFYAVNVAGRLVPTYDGGRFIRLCHAYRRLHEGAPC